MFNLPERTILGVIEIIEIYEFFDVPRLFSVRNRTGSTYLAVSTFDDGDSFEWLYVEISIDRMNCIINDQVCLQTAFTQPENGFLYKVKTGFDESSTVEPIFPEQLQEEDLPLKGAYLNTKKAKSYGLGFIDPKLSSLATNRETFNIHLYPWNTKLPELNCRALGNILISTQELTEATAQACHGEPTIKGAIPADVINQSRLSACQIFEGSFGLQLKAEEPSDLFGDSLLAKSLKEILELLGAEDDEALLNTKLHQLKGRVASKYRRFLKEINNLKSGIKIDWGSPNLGFGGSISLSSKKIENAFLIVDKIEIEMSESLDINATLIGLNVRTKRYELLSTTDQITYSGRVSDDALKEVQDATIQKNYIATLKKVIETKSSSGDENIKWVLTSLKNS